MHEKLCEHNACHMSKSIISVALFDCLANDHNNFCGMWKQVEQFLYNNNDLS